MEISAKLVKELRDKTGAGMMDCKRALVETNGNIEEAADHLRKKGLMDAAKKSSRTAADGLVAFAISGDAKIASLVEVNSETDFVARNDKFQDLVESIAGVALEADKIDDSFLSSKSPKSGLSLKEDIDLLISLVGENMSFRRATKLSVDNGAISAYIHSAIKPGMGKIGVLVAIECDSSDSSKKDKIEEVGKKIAMHVAAANPSYLSPEFVSQDVVAKEKSIVLEQAKELGKPADVAEKMAEGRVKKFFEEATLLEQFFVMDPKSKIKDVIESFNKENNTKIFIKSFEKFVLGEGIEKAENNFAEEVQSFIK